MNRLFADFFSGLIIIFHILVVLALVGVYFYLNGEQSAALNTDEKFAFFGYTMAALIAYIFIMGMIYVVLAIHEDIQAIRQTLEENIKKIN